MSRANPLGKEMLDPSKDYPYAVAALACVAPTATGSILYFSETDSNFTIEEQAITLTLIVLSGVFGPKLYEMLSFKKKTKNTPAVAHA